MNDSDDQLCVGIYSWSQTDEQVTISFLVPENSKSKDVSIDIESQWLVAGLKGQDPVFNAKLYQPINKFDSLWQIEKMSATPTSSLTVSPTLSIASSYAFMSSPNHSPNSSMILPVPAFPDPSMNDEVADLLQRTAALGSTPTSPSSSRPSSPVAITTPPSLATPPHLQAESSLQQACSTKYKLLTIHLEKDAPGEWALPVSVAEDKKEADIDPQSAYLLGAWLHSRAAKIEMATAYYTSAAERGHVQAMMNLALLYDKPAGDSMENHQEVDRQKAFEWYKRASEAGDKSDAHACYIVGGAYAKGAPEAGIEKDYALALRYYNRAMEISASHIKIDFGILDGDQISKSDLRSHPPSQLHERNFCNAALQTGLLLWDGTDAEGADARPELALRYFKEAALLGCARAAHYMGMAYNDGMGVDKDEFEACKWFTRAHTLETGIPMPRGIRQIDWDISRAEYQSQQGRRRRRRHAKKRYAKRQSDDGLLAAIALGSAAVVAVAGAVWWWRQKTRKQ